MHHAPSFSPRCIGYRKHRASGQAIVTLSGQDFYLVPYGKQVRRLEYDRYVAEWLARGRLPLTSNGDAADTITAVGLIAACKRIAETYYRKRRGIRTRLRSPMRPERTSIQ